MDLRLKVALRLRFLTGLVYHFIFGTLKTAERVLDVENFLSRYIVPLELARCIVFDKDIATSGMIHLRGHIAAGL